MNPDAFADGRSTIDEVIQLREWGTDRAQPLPRDGALIGTDDEGGIRITDPQRLTSRIHAQLRHDHGRWVVDGTCGVTGLWLDGIQRDAFGIDPGVEIGIGGITLVAESPRLVAVRCLLARVLGWSSERLAVVDQALRSVRLAANRRATLVVMGAKAGVPIAHALHRRMLGSDHPFVTCNPRRRATKASVRSVANHPHGMSALEAARGGTLCVMSQVPPRDLAQVMEAARDPNTRVQLVVCSHVHGNAHGFPTMPIDVPSIASRAHELPRIVEEYAHDAIEQLGTRAEFTPHDQRWVIDHAAESLGAIEKATLRLVALRMCGSITGAAACLGMSHVALSRWLRRRRRHGG